MIIMEIQHTHDWEAVLANFIFGNYSLDGSAVPKKNQKNGRSPFPAIYWEYQQSRIQLTSSPSQL